MEFVAKMIDGVLEIYPNVEKIPNAQGGTDIIVHALNPAVIQEAKINILNKLARGEKVEMEVIKTKDGVGNIQ